MGVRIRSLGRHVSEPIVATSVVKASRHQLYLAPPTLTLSLSIAITERDAAHFRLQTLKHPGERSIFGRVKRSLSWSSHEVRTEGTAASTLPNSRTPVDRATDRLANY